MAVGIFIDLGLWCTFEVFCYCGTCRVVLALLLLSRIFLAGSDQHGSASFGFIYLFAQQSLFILPANSGTDWYLASLGTRGTGTCFKSQLIIIAVAVAVLGDTGVLGVVGCLNCSLCLPVLGIRNRIFLVLPDPRIRILPFSHKGVERTEIMLV